MMSIKYIAQHLSCGEGSIITAAIANSFQCCTQGVLSPSPTQGFDLVGSQSSAPGQLFLVPALTPASPEGLSSELMTHCPGIVFQGPAPQSCPTEA